MLLINLKPDECKSIKIAYLHGLESSGKRPKNAWLHAHYRVYDPAIDYKKEAIYADIRVAVRDFAPDFLVGSSMGGYFSFYLAQELNIPALLFNPALTFRSMEPDMIGKEENPSARPFIRCVFGEQDDVILPQNTCQFLEEYVYENFDLTYYSHGHRTPFEVFEKEVSRFAGEVRVM